MKGRPRNAPAVEAAVVGAVSSVCDPEYPEITIADLGILERVCAGDDGRSVRVELVPTMLGCPALDVIARDVTDAARSACGASEVSVEVVFVADPVWTPDRIAPAAVEFMAREYSVAVRRARPQSVRSDGAQPDDAQPDDAQPDDAQPDNAQPDAVCPVCNSAGLEHRSDFGPTPCRSVYWCPSCRNPVEVVGRSAGPASVSRR
ncbi:metal-sulfur cluster assembly factor [Candidatus Poriferisodalis sp.]|uniref:metal-sulfur cluster assembly factor n=1 Tax=Candidatus Poriferisodalis sp. TaxID=3101277 RepID=UPI003B024BB4